MDIDTPELRDIELRIMILDKILQEARQVGDERWKEPARQIEQLNEQRGQIIKAERERRGLELPQVTIQAKLGTMGAKTNG